MIPVVVRFENRVALAMFENRMASGLQLAPAFSMQMKDKGTKNILSMSMMTKRDNNG